MHTSILRHAVAACVLAALLATLAACGGKQAPRISSVRKSRSFAIVMTKPGDSFESLANRYLGDPEKAWLIAEYNQTTVVQPGGFLVVPTEPVNKGGLTHQGYQVVPVLTYSAFSESTTDKITITGARFQEQMRYLKQNGYHPIELAKLYDFMEFKDAIPDKAVVITIDDIGQGTYDIAYPILREFDYPATVFVCTDLVTGNENALDWDKVRTMRDNGIAIEHRTKTLRNLTRRKTGETFEDYVLSVDREITVANLKFLDELGTKRTFMAYPFGASNEMVVALLKKNEFRGALTLSEGANPFFTDSFAVHRTTIPGDMTMEQFQKVLATFVKEDLQ